MNFSLVGWRKWKKITIILLILAAINVGTDYLRDFYEVKVKTKIKEQIKEKFSENLVQDKILRYL
jgi:regulatory protein YycI of two-component signal transduction system YycFG